MDDSLFDEFGNYIGPKIESDHDSDREPDELKDDGGADTSEQPLEQPIIKPVKDMKFEIGVKDSSNSCKGRVSGRVLHAYLELHVLHWLDNWLLERLFGCVGTAVIFGFVGCTSCRPCSN
ncbi:hypothetical protein SESBI_15661 [Sesbania bispinosa]|nr:hypothetical protein SESBI_15661 [Sesbania bispinosa]